MKKIMMILAALLLPITLAAAESCTVSFEGNATTGYVWSGFVLGGDSVELADMEGEYIPDDNPAQLAGAGGMSVFSLNAVHPGESIIVFNYARSWEEGQADQRVIWASVDDDLHIYTADVTEDGVLDGMVLDVDPAEHSALMTTERLGDVIIRFDTEDALPVADEHIVIYANGTMTMSLPPIVNAIAWRSVPAELARD